MKKEYLTEERTLPLTEAAKKDEKALKIRIGTFNIQNGLAVNHDFSLLAEDITEMKLDIVGLQEVDIKTVRNGKQDTLKLLSEATGMKYYGFAKAMKYDGGEYGTAILSKYPLEEWEVKPLDAKGLEPRAYGKAVIDADGVKINMINTHLSWDPSYTLQKVQLKAMGELFSTLKNAIFTADVNEPDIAYYKPFFKNCKFANDEKEPFKTFYSSGSPIDNIITSENSVQLRKGMVTSPKHSDHYLLWADVVFTDL